MNSIKPHLDKTGPRDRSSRLDYPDYGLITRRALLGTLALTAVGLTSCRFDDPPLALAFLADLSHSSDDHRGAGRRGLRRLMQRAAVPPASPIAFVRFASTAAITWSGSLTSTVEVLAAFDEAWANPVIRTGTDPVSALELALWWLEKPEQRSLPRKVIVGWSDMISDPAKSAGHIHTFRQPEAFTWPGAKQNRVELYLFGVPPARQTELERAWTPYLATLPRFFEPAHAIRPQDLRLEDHLTW